jgi:predicted ferric reductase
MIKVEGGRFAYSAGQYVFLTIPAVAQLPAHPFSILSAPDGEKGGEFTVHVKSIGAWERA